MSTSGPMLPTMVVSGPIDMTAIDLEAARRRIPSATVHRSTLLSWQIIVMVIATLLVLGWMCIIALLILQEMWQLVLVAWVLLYAAAQFSYCYCKRNSVANLKRQLRLHIVAQVSEGQYHGVVSTEKKDDKPPSYIDAIDMEQPPPTYIMAVKHIRSCQYSEENESCKGLTEDSAKNSSGTISNNRDVILNPNSSVLTSAVLPIAMAIPYSSSTLSLTSLASVHSNKSANDISAETTIKTVSKSISPSHPSVTSASE